MWRKWTFQNNCDKVKSLIQKGAIIQNREGRVCIPDGSWVPNIPHGASLVERVERYYATMKPSQAYYGTFEEVEENMSGIIPRETTYANREVDDREQRIAKLEKGMELKERENALKIKQMKFEGRGLEKADVASYRLECFNNELSALQEEKPGFL